MALVVYGFPTQVQALQFEWAWQHPDKSRAVREVAAGLKKHQKYGTGGKVRGGWPRPRRAPVRRVV
jgi:structure-specific endonuclease subunit SLX1